MGDSQSSIIKSLSQDKVESLIVDTLAACGAFDAPTKVLNFDRAWQDPHSRTTLAMCLGRFIELKWEQNPSLPPCNAIVGIIKVRPPLGSLMLLPEVCNYLDCPLGIWKENGDLITGAPTFHGTKESDGLLVVHDIVQSGLTVVRAMLDLDKHNRTPLGVISIAAQNPGASKPSILGAFQSRTEKSLHIVEEIFATDRLIARIKER